MQAPDKQLIIDQTKKWIADVVIACNFCPFAAREVKRGSILYEVLPDATPEAALKAVATMFAHLDENAEIETALIILPGSHESFDDYLNLVQLADDLLIKEAYEGIYQLASFHPKYVFAGSSETDASNFTNRSPYPMLHFLREESVSKAVDAHPDIDAVPMHNIEFAQNKGLTHMQQLLDACMLPPFAATGTSA
ncbi:MAG: DUF1415 domain-containing protein [Chitinophagaceae bacterium]|nr:MAG: DUF1415 domain-containing protein [Chitinophagaceae bacterium]